MALPEFNEFGDLPAGVYDVPFSELIVRYGTGSPQREAVASRLQHIFKVAVGTGALDRLVIFGSFVTDKLEPNDVDVVLVMRDDFRPNLVSPEALALFDHNRADKELGASIFWIRPGMLIGVSVDELIRDWQLKRDGNRRGIVEVRV
jgi:hypothetical protein